MCMCERVQACACVQACVCVGRGRVSEWVCARECEYICVCQPCHTATGTSHCSAVEPPRLRVEVGRNGALFFNDAHTLPHSPPRTPDGSWGSGSGTNLKSSCTTAAAHLKNGTREVAQGPVLVRRQGDMRGAVAAGNSLVDGAPRHVEHIAHLWSSCASEEQAACVLKSLRVQQLCIWAWGTHANGGKTRETALQHQHFLARTLVGLRRSAWCVTRRLRGCSHDAGGLFPAGPAL